VFLARRPEEPPDAELLAFYGRLLEALRKRDFLDGMWYLCERTGWPDNATYLNLVSWCWQKGDSRCLMVANLSATASQCLVRIPWEDLEGRIWQLQDAFTSALYERDGNEMCGSGMYVNLPAWGFHLLEWL